MQPLGFWLNCDVAVCAACYTPDDWTGFSGWTGPLPIFADSCRDTPTHCEECGALIPHALTDYGTDYVVEAVRVCLLDGRRNPVAELWTREYGAEGVDLAAFLALPLLVHANLAKYAALLED